MKNITLFTKREGVTLKINDTVENSLRSFLFASLEILPRFSSSKKLFIFSRNYVLTLWIYFFKFQIFNGYQQIDAWDKGEDEIIISFDVEKEYDNKIQNENY